MKNENEKQKTKNEKQKMKNEKKTLEVVSVSESVSDSVRNKFHWRPRPRWPFWGLLSAI